MLFRSIGAAMRAPMNKYHWGKCTDPELNKYVSDFKHDLDCLIGIEKFDQQNLTRVLYASGGCAYRLSRKALTGISNYLDHAKSLQFAYEDLFIGQIMMLNNIKITKKIIGRHHRIPN